MIGKTVTWIQGGSAKTGPHHLKGKVLGVVRKMESAWKILKEMGLKRQTLCCNQSYRGDRLIVETETGIKIVFSTNVYEVGE
ncbi:hypothetical protein [Leptospira stimsonii]|uniref:Uncharacterized protein n=1 Tax=Leptospira stimsonii TaxID=2202203 RepID=A0ABY2MXV7_9LEPT|nr:hypothetical protein [Leptospira stimsonii]TGK12833.1 hypothetical protein EHO98_19535 [Leptospira stimsonii]TGM11087.1 hypothetical protein EHQ90_16850 [Leptospira stimsonii]